MSWAEKLRLSLLHIWDDSRFYKFWKHILNNKESRLDIWKSRLLSRVGRAQRIRSIVNNLPSYYLSVFKLPTLVDNRIILLQKKFSWSSTDDLTAPKELGGLGFGSAVVKNIGFLLKWW